MDNIGKLEIYIPSEAEVTSISIRSLPSNILRRMGLSLPDGDGTRKPPESPEGIWICPAVLRNKGQRQAPGKSNGLIETISAQMVREFQAAPGPFQMSFVSSNRQAYNVLKDTMPGKRIPADETHTSHLSPGSIPPSYQGAVVIYNGRIYLSMRKPKRNQKTQESKPVPQPSSGPSVLHSDDSSKSQKKEQPPKASLKPAPKEVKRKRLRITFPTKKAKIPVTKTDNPSIAVQEQPNDRRTHTTCKEAPSNNKKDVTIEGGLVSSSQSAGSVLPSTGSGEKADIRAEQAADPEPAWWEEEAGDYDGETRDLGGEEAAGHSSYVDGNTCNMSDDPDSSSQNWTRTEYQGGASASTSRQQEFDFTELAQEEKIAQAIAKYRQCEAALNSLNSSS